MSADDKEAYEDKEPPSMDTKDAILNSQPAGPCRNRLTTFQKLSYGVGHFYNDMCASMWFTYLLLFYHFVVRISNTYAGLLLLIGQVADAMATPVVGFLCDKTRFRYGRRKIWHLAGTIMVTFSLFFFWHDCLLCGAHPSDTTNPTGEIIYFSVFIVIFQFGWAAVQVSHLSLIPELTSNESERVGLNAIRYAFTILANLGVFATMFVLLMVVSGSSLKPHDEWVFSGTALGIIAVGLVFTFVFHVGTTEPSTPAEQKQEMACGRKIAWYKWFGKPHFYLVAVIYMCTRLVVNLTQIYTPLYLVDSIRLTKSSVAIGPLVIYCSGFLVTCLLRRFNKLIGRYMAYFCGLAGVWAALIWVWVQPTAGPHTDLGDAAPTANIVYGATIFLGAGGSTLLVTSLSMVADLIDCSVGSSAFVYGLMSFTDKLSNGIAVQIIQLMHPCKGHGSEVCCPACVKYYHNVLVYVPGGASLLACVTLGLLVLYITCRQKRQCSDSPICPTESEKREPSLDPNGCNKTIQDLTTPGAVPLSPGRESVGSDNSDETTPLLKKPLC